MEELKISVIVPVYNTLHCLERCVDSISRQTYKNLEIILVDDGSTDGTGQLCDILAKRDERIRVYHKENGGASSARNLGLQKAAGDYVGFVDSDDYIDADVYQKMAELVMEKGYPVVQISRDERDEAGNRLADVCIPPKAVRFCNSETFLKELFLLYETVEKGIVRTTLFSGRRAERGFQAFDRAVDADRRHCHIAKAGLPCGLSERQYDEKTF